MKAALFAFCLVALTLHTGAGEFTKSSAFGSVEAFVAAAAEFRPATSTSDLAELFTVRELGQPEDPRTGTPVAATAIKSSAALWSNDTHALVFVTATPPIEATRAVAGVLFLLNRAKGTWHVSDSLRFTATGKDAGVEAKLTAGTGVGYQLGSESNKPVVTVKESQGGRGYAYQASASYTLEATRLKRLELE